MPLDQHLVDAAVAQLDRRWGEGAAGVAAALLLENGEILTGINLDNYNAAAGLCAETGAMCDAYRLDVAVVASACIAREEGEEQIRILAPCGICQERLALWGPAVEVAVADDTAPQGWSARTLLELHPHYWAAQFAAGDGPWPAPAEHRW